MTQLLCDSCRFYEKQPSQAEMGYCRRRSPSPLLEAIAVLAVIKTMSKEIQNDIDEAGVGFYSDEDTSKGRASWPLVHETDWCGDHAAVV